MSNWQKGRSKGASELDTKIKAMLWEGYPASQIARSLGTTTTSVYNVKNGRRGYSAPWPDSSTGLMPEPRMAYLAQFNSRGLSKEDKERYALMRDIGEEASSVSVIAQGRERYEEALDAHDYISRLFFDRFGPDNPKNPPADVSKAEKLRQSWEVDPSLEESTVTDTALIEAADKLEKKYG